MSDKDIKTIYELTKPERFVQLNPNVWDCYVALHPNDAALTNCLLCRLLTNKFYKKHNLPEEEKDGEDKRIYTSICLKANTILWKKS